MQIDRRPVVFFREFCQFFTWIAAQKEFSFYFGKALEQCQIVFGRITVIVSAVSVEIGRVAIVKSLFVITGIYNPQGIRILYLDILQTACVLFCKGFSFVLYLL